MEGYGQIRRGGPQFTKDQFLNLQERVNFMIKFLTEPDNYTRLQKTVMPLDDIIDNYNKAAIIMNDAQNVFLNQPGTYQEGAIKADTYSSLCQLLWNAVRYSGQYLVNGIGLAGYDNTYSAVANNMTRFIGSHLNNVIYDLNQLESRLHRGRNSNNDPIVNPPELYNEQALVYAYFQMQNKQVQAQQMSFGYGQGQQNFYSNGQSQQNFFGYGQGSQQNFFGYGQGQQNFFGNDQGSQQNFFGNDQSQQDLYGNDQGSQQNFFGNDQSQQNFFGNDQSQQNFFGNDQSGPQFAVNESEQSQPSVTASEQPQSPVDAPEKPLPSVTAAEQLNATTTEFVDVVRNNSMDTNYSMMLALFLRVEDCIRKTTKNFNPKFVNELRKVTFTMQKNLHLLNTPAQNDGDVFRRLDVLRTITSYAHHFSKSNDPNEPTLLSLADNKSTLPELQYLTQRLAADMNAVIAEQNAISNAVGAKYSGAPKPQDSIPPIKINDLRSVTKVLNKSVSPDTSFNEDAYNALMNYNEAIAPGDLTDHSTQAIWPYWKSLLEFYGQLERYHDQFMKGTKPVSGEAKSEALRKLSKKASELVETIDKLPQTLPNNKDDVRIMRILPVRFAVNEINKQIIDKEVKRLGGEGIDEAELNSTKSILGVDVEDYPKLTEKPVHYSFGLEELKDMTDALRRFEKIVEGFECYDTKKTKAAAELSKYAEKIYKELKSNKELFKHQWDNPRDLENRRAVLKNIFNLTEAFYYQGKDFLESYHVCDENKQVEQAMNSMLGSVKMLRDDHFAAHGTWSRPALSPLKRRIPPVRDYAAERQIIKELPAREWHYTNAEHKDLQKALAAGFELTLKYALAETDVKEGERLRLVAHSMFKLYEAVQTNPIGSLGKNSTQDDFRNAAATLAQHEYTMRNSLNQIRAMIPHMRNTDHSGTIYEFLRQFSYNCNSIVEDRQALQLLHYDSPNQILAKHRIPQASDVHGNFGDDAEDIIPKSFESKKTDVMTPEENAFFKDKKFYTTPATCEELSKKFRELSVYVLGDPMKECKNPGERSGLMNVSQLLLAISQQLRAGKDLFKEDPKSSADLKNIMEAQKKLIFAKETVNTIHQVLVKAFWGSDTLVLGHVSAKVDNIVTDLNKALKDCNLMTLWKEGKEKEYRLGDVFNQISKDETKERKDEALKAAQEKDIPAYLNTAFDPLANKLTPEERKERLEFYRFKTAKEEQKKWEDERAKKKAEEEEKERKRKEKQEADNKKREQQKKILNAQDNKDLHEIHREASQGNENAGNENQENAENLKGAENPENAEHPQNAENLKEAENPENAEHPQNAENQINKNQQNADYQEDEEDRKRLRQISLNMNKPERLFTPKDLETSLEHIEKLQEFYQRLRTTEENKNTLKKENEYLSKLFTYISNMDTYYVVNPEKWNSEKEKQLNVLENIAAVNEFLEKNARKHINDFNHNESRSKEKADFIKAMQELRNHANFAANNLYYQRLLRDADAEIEYLYTNRIEDIPEQKDKTEVNEEIHKGIREEVNEEGSKRVNESSESVENAGLQENAQNSAGLQENAQNNAGSQENVQNNAGSQENVQNNAGPQEVQDEIPPKNEVREDEEPQKDYNSENVIDTHIVQESYGHAEERGSMNESAPVQHENEKKNGPVSFADSNVDAGKLAEEYLNEFTRLRNELVRTDSSLSNDTKPYKDLRTALNNAVKAMSGDAFRELPNKEKDRALKGIFESIQKPIKEYRQAKAELGKLSSRQIKRLKVMNRISLLNLGYRNNNTAPYSSYDLKLAEKLVNNFLVEQAPKNKDAAARLISEKDFFRQVIELKDNKVFNDYRKTLSDKEKTLKKNGASALKEFRAWVRQNDRIMPAVLSDKQVPQAENQMQM